MPGLRYAAVVVKHGVGDSTTFWSGGCPMARRRFGKLVVTYTTDGRKHRVLFARGQWQSVDIAQGHG